MRTHAPLHLEQLATRRSEVVSSVDKQGRTGPLTFVTVRHEYQQDGVTAIEAEDDIVYRPAHGPADKMPADARQHLGPPEGEELLTVDIGATFLFRYSALTYNAHRIHYDRDWCAREGYAGLVIHGPLQVLFIAEALRHHSPALLGTQLDYRLVRPLVGEQQVSVRRLPDGGLVVVGADGAVTATATVTRLSGNGPPTGPS